MYPRIRELREDSDFSQKEVAKLLNCSQQAYSNYELGTRDVPISVLEQLALIYKDVYKRQVLIGVTVVKSSPHRATRRATFPSDPWTMNT